MPKYRGIPVSKGIAIGNVFKYSREKPLVEEYEINNEQVTEEINKFSDAKIRANKYLRKIKEKASKELGTIESQIFDAHIYMLNDPVLDEEIKSFIKNDKINVEAAIQKAIDNIREKFMKLDNDYFYERLKDIQDVGNHLLRAISGDMNTLQNLPEDAIIIAEDLTPSETALLDKENLSGFVLTHGGSTAHTTIIAKSLMIPAVINVKGDILDKVKQKETVILDATNGQVFFDPERRQIERYRNKITVYNKKEKELLDLKDEETITRDGFKVDLAANINSLEEISAVKEVCSDGIGLFRTEFLYRTEQNLLDLEKQSRIYNLIAEKMKHRPVVVRTLDIGGDKDLPYFQVDDEINPFLGWRGIRISLERRDIFKTQLKALLIASNYGNIKILLPFISSLQELREAKGIFIEVENELEQENIPYDREIEVGMMVEIPSVAVMADVFAAEVDFFSIGTNDLIQYTLAVDRNNSKIADLYTPYHPSILRLIKKVVDAAHNSGIWVSICGEAASSPLLVPLFIAMGITELSMSSGYILETKKLIRRLDRTNLIYHFNEIMKKNTADEVKRYLEKNLVKKDKLKVERGY